MNKLNTQTKRHSGFRGIRIKSPFKNLTREELRSFYLVKKLDAINNINVSTNGIMIDMVDGKLKEVKTSQEEYNLIMTEAKKIFKNINLS